MIKHNSKGRKIAMYWYSCVLFLSLILAINGQDNVVCTSGKTQFSLNGPPGQCDKDCAADVNTLKKQVALLAQAVRDLQKAPTPAPTTQPTTTQPPTTTEKRVCYVYTILDNAMVDYAGAVKACQEAGFQLAEHFLHSGTAAEREKIGRQAEGNKVFVGLRRPDNDLNGWKYLDGTVSTKANTPWSPGKPNNWNNWNEACVEMYGNSSPYYLLNDITCDLKRYPFCQKYIC